MSMHTVNRCIISYCLSVLKDEVVVFGERNVMDWLAYTNMKRGLQYLNGRSKKWITDRFYEYVANGVY